MDSRIVSTLARGVASSRGVIWNRAASSGGLLRAALLASTALTVAAYSAPAWAQDATWLATPADGIYNNGNNWNTGAVPTGTATFGASATTALTLDTAGNYGGWTFNAGASDYIFDLTANQFFTGAGIVINGGSATINNNDNSTLYFLGASTAGSATINNNNGTLYFGDTSTAGSAIINNIGILNFADTATAGSATINNSSILYFLGNSTAGSATITNDGALYFYNTSTAGSATITNDGGIYFYGNSTADSATITSNNILNFDNTSTAGSASITNSGILYFGGASTAGSAIIANQHILNFDGVSTADNAIITNDGDISFFDASTAGNATITNDGGLYFYNTSTAGDAAITNNPGGFADFSGTSGPNGDGRISAGSIAGPGSYILGAIELTVGSNNLSTEVSGTISGEGGALIKIGTGTLILSGTNSYNGGTTINGGTLQLGNGGMAGSILGTVSVGAGGRFDVVNADTSGVTSLANAGGIVNVGDDIVLAASTISNTGAGQINLGARATLYDNGSALNNDATINVGTGGIVMSNGDINNNTGGVINFNGTGGTAQLSPAGSVYNSGQINVAGGDVQMPMSNLDNQSGGSVSLTGGDMFGVSTFTNSAGATLNVGAGHKLSVEFLNFNGGTATGAGTIEAANAFALWGTGTIGTTLAGAASLSRSGPGTTVLTGAHTYTGGTTINAGTLQLGDVNTAGAILGAVNVTGYSGTFDVVDADTSGITSITNSGTTNFRNGTSAGSAAIANDGNLYFYDTSTAGNAAITNNLGGTVDFSGTTGPNGDGRISAGSIAGPGIYLLGSNELTVGSNDRSTEVSGVISGDGGSLVKIGTGTLTLSGANTYTGGTTINDGILQLGNGAGTGSILGDVVNNGVLTFNRSDVVTFSGVISGSGAVRKIGDGTTILTGTNTYTGGTTIAGRTLQLGNGGGTGSILGNIVNDGVLTLNRSGTLTLAGDISGSGAVQQIGPGTTILTGTNSYSGDTLVTDGRLQFGGGSAGGSNRLGGNLVVAGGTLAIQTPSTVSVAEALMFGDNTALSIGAGANGPALSANSVAIGNTVTFNISGIGDTSQLDKVLINTTSGISGDFATVTVGGFSGTVDYLTVSTRKSANNLQYLASYGLSWTANNNLAHGTFTLTNATDSFTVGTALADQAANAATGWNGNALTKAGAGTLILTGGNTYSGGTTIVAGTLQIGNGGASGSILGNVVNNGLLAFNRSDAITFAGDISGSGSVAKQGAGTLTLAGNNSYSGGTIVSGGTLSISSDGNLGNGGTLALLDGTTLAFTQGGTYTHAITVAGDPTFDVATGLTVTQSGVIADGSSAGDIVKTGAGTLVLTANNTYSGGTTISGGTLEIGNGGATGSILGNVLNNGVLAFNRSDVATFAGDISGSGVVQQIGSGTTILTGANSYTGGTTIANGTLQLGDLNAAGAIAGAVSVASGGTFDVVNANTSGITGITNDGITNFRNGTSAGSANITNNNGLSFYDNSTAGSATITTNYGGALYFRGTSTAGDATITNNERMYFNNASTAGSATITNRSGLYFNNASTAGSATIINNGDFYFYGNSTAGSAAVTNNLGGTVDFSNSTGPNGDGKLSAGSIAGAGNYLLGANELTVGSNNLSTEVSGVISGTGSLVKVGTGTLTLSGANSSVGAVTASNGTLAFSQAGTFSATSYETQAGAVTAIGGAAQLAVAGAFTQDAGSTLNVTLGSNEPIITADSASLSGTLNIAGVTGSTLTPSSASALAGTRFTVIATTTGITGDFAGVSVGGSSSPVDYLTVMGGKSADNLDYNIGIDLTWTAGAAQGNGTFTLTNSTEAFNVDVALTNQAGPFASGWDGKSLTKAGDGMLTLSAMNTYTGTTTINGGTLAITATGGITSDVSNNATFRNAGTVTGSVTNNAGATFTQTEGGVSNGVINYGTVNANGGALNGTIVNNAGGLFTVGGTLTDDSTFDNANGATLAVSATGDYTLAGLLTNSGAVTVAAGGSLTAPAGILNNAGGVITNNGTVTDALDNAGLVTNNGAYNADVASNTGTINNAANGTWTGNFNTAGIVNNDGTINGSLTQTAGTTTNNGTITGAVTVSGGLFTGAGSAGGLTIASGATIAPGIGTINVGNITFNPGSTYQVAVNAAGQGSRINATGTIAINGGAVNVLAGSGNYGPSTTYTILSTTTNGGRTGTFDSVSSNLAFLIPTLGYDASDVYLTMTRNSIDFAGVGITPNQIATGGGVESLGRGNPVYDAVLNLSADQAQYAFDQLSGEIHASARTALIEDSRFIRSAVNDRIRAAFDAVGASGTVTTYVDGKPVSAPASTDRLAVWSEALGSWGHMNGDGNAARLDRSTGGFFIGADAPVFDTIFNTWRFGAVAGYSRTTFDVNDRRSSGASDNYHVGLYGGTQWGVSGGDFAFRTGAAYTWHDISTSRTVMFPGLSDSLTGDYNAATAQVFGELAYGFTAGAAWFEPFANLAYVNLHTDGFTETGGAAALTGAAANTDATLTTLGLRASTTFDLAGTTLTANGMLGWRHAFGDVTPLSTMRFAGGGDAFSIGGVPITRDAAVIEAGLDYAITPNATLGVSYGGQFGSEMSDQSARANFNLKF